MPSEDVVKVGCSDVAMVVDCSSRILNISVEVNSLMKNMLNR